MKRIVLGAVALFGGVLFGAEAPIFHITLLGNGVPYLNPITYLNQGRVNTAILVETGPNNSERMLFDCGQGTVTRLLQSGGADPVNNPNAAVDKVFISHLHSDHYSDLASLYSYGWLFRYDAPLRLWGPGAGPNGPFGMAAIAALLRMAYDADFNIRNWGFKNFQFPASGGTPLAADLSEGVVYGSQGVTVSAFVVDHRPVDPAYGFRITYDNHSIVYSGDTNYNTNLIKNSQKADVLIHEIYGMPREDGPEIYDYHTPPADWARVMSATSPKLAVMSHIAMSEGDTTTDLVNRVRAAGYAGPIQVGADLMTIDVTATAVTAKAAARVPPVTMLEPTGGLFPEMLRRRGGRIID